LRGKGKTWIEEKQSLVLKMPSSVVHHDNNFVINPLHPDFSSLKIGQPQALQIDPRLARPLFRPNPYFAHLTI